MERKAYQLGAELAVQQLLLSKTAAEIPRQMWTPLSSILVGSTAGAILKEDPVAGAVAGGLTGLTSWGAAHALRRLAKAHALKELLGATGAAAGSTGGLLAAQRIFGEKKLEEA